MLEAYDLPLTRAEEHGESLYDGDDIPANVSFARGFGGEGEEETQAENGTNC